jgi:hypothetical protein
MNACWFYRKRVSWAAHSQGGLPGCVQRHLHACASCRRFHHDQARLTAALTADPGAHLAELPPFLHARIMSGLTRPAPSSAQRDGWGAVGAVLIPALGVLLITAFFWWIRPARPLADAAAPAAATATPSSVEADPGPIVAWMGKVDQPLERELKLVVSDGKTALRSLAGNFLPDPQPPGQ